MKLDFSQKMWIQGYKQAEQKGGTFDEYQNWTPFEEIPVPEWYESYLQSMEVPEPISDPAADLIAKAKELRAGHGEGDGVEAVSAKADSNEGSTPSQSTREFFREAGRRGGQIRAQKLSPERRSEIARLAGLRKGKA
jgi:hypothetical protein